MKIALIGPIKPYRGGIAHFNDCIKTELESQNHELLVISWRKRYPNFLYPGKCQFDPSEKKRLLLDKIFLLHIFNPLSWVSAAIRIREFSPDQVLYNWVTPFLSPVLFLISFIVGFKSSINQTLICHNVLPHESRIFDRVLAKIVFHQMDKFIVHADQEKSILINLLTYCSKPNIKLGFHPKYNFFTQNRTTVNIKEKLPIDKNSTILLFFGYVRPYKGLTHLISSLNILTQQTEKKFHLIIAGEIWEGKKEYLDQIKNYQLENMITIFDVYIPDNEVGNYFEAADLVVLPYENATQSGIAQIALTFNKPTILTNVGGLVDMNRHSLVHIVKPGDANTLAETILLVTNQEKNMNLSNKHVFENASWADYVNLIIT